MKRLNKNSKSGLANGRSHARKMSGSSGVALFLLLAGIVMLSACGGSSSSNSSQNGALSGNWQFTMISPDPNYPASTQYGLQGGFVLQSNGTVSGQVLYSVASDVLVNGLAVVCNSGAAAVTGTVSGQSVTLTAVAGPQTFQLTGTLSADGSSITSGTFTTTGGGMVNNAVCGAATTQGSWSAISVPPLSGSISGTFHSVGASMTNQDFQLTGALSQEPNTGASSATVNGNLSFVDPATLVTSYPCFPNGAVSVTGQISGNTVILQLVGTDGSQDGQIGVSAAQTAGSQLSPVTFDQVAPAGSYVLHSSGEGYQVNTKSCSDFGYVCLALNKATPCQQPITLSPPALVFSPQLLVCTSLVCPPNGLGTATTQTITLTNNQASGAAPLTNLNLQFSPQLQSDFTGIPDFSESDNCASFLASSTFGQSCTISITYAPQESCPWVPASGIANSCPFNLTAQLTIQSSVTNDNDQLFTVPVTGTGLSYIQPSPGEVDFGAEAVGEASQPQLVSFTNQSQYPVQIVGPRTASCPFIPEKIGDRQQQIDLPRPVVNDGSVGGLQVVAGYFPNYPPQLQGQTVGYFCDGDETTGLPNFPLSSDTCTGTLLQPQATCSVEIAFVPQPYYNQQGQGSDYFLELNTLECYPGAAGSNCEIDSGRFPVEVRANPASPLRLLPAAGINFGGVPSGKTSASQEITLFNDPADPNSATVNFLGRFTVSGSFSESDDCPFSLAPGSNCTISVSFKPSSKGASSGTLGIFYSFASSVVAANPQFIYLRGTGQ